ncbi:MAG: threonine aldolase [Isosphaeraceae bacterium]|jgi:D-serine deaminase-like pyridoxal phosphate-dependent protein|nr:MAG: threonine aldolase [Isosphaeraceae bacterium]
MNTPPEYRIDQPDRLPSPSLLVFRPLVHRNLDTLLRIARSPARLRPHVKTHKMAALVRMVEAAGIHQHKCATIAEAELIARAGGRDVLLAYPLVGPNLGRWADLIGRYPETTFRAVVDSIESVHALDMACSGLPRPTPVLVDLNVGMNRTGVPPEQAEPVYHAVAAARNLTPDGLHAYDGHHRHPDPQLRYTAARLGFEAVQRLRDQLQAHGLPVPRLVLGGTPTFPCHAQLDDPGVECSPGTLIFHDHGYATQFPDLPFQPAALLLTRVISRPAPHTLCLDLGHKAVAADPPGDRLRLLGLDDAQLGAQSEEHLVVRTPQAAGLPPGTPLLAIPTHICPTCALHQEALVIDDGQLVDVWTVAARDRRIGI